MDKSSTGGWSLILEPKWCLKATLLSKIVLYATICICRSLELSTILVWINPTVAAEQIWFKALWFMSHGGWLHAADKKYLKLSAFSGFTCILNHNHSLQCNTLLKRRFYLIQYHIIVIGNQLKCKFEVLLGWKEKRSKTTTIIYFEDNVDIIDVKTQQMGW